MTTARARSSVKLRPSESFAPTTAKRSAPRFFAPSAELELCYCVDVSEAVMGRGDEGEGPTWLSLIAAA